MFTAILILTSFAWVVCAGPLSLPACAVSLSLTPALHEFVANAPEGYIKVGPAPGSEQLTLQLGLVSKDLAGLEKTLYDVSTPNSQLYGKHLTKEQVEAFVAPVPETVSAVNQWLSSFGVNSTTISPAGDWIEVNVPVSHANQMFSTNFSTYSSQKNGEKVTRTLSYSIPPGLQGKLEVVHPTVTFPLTFGIPKFTTPMPLVKPSNITSDAVPASCSSIITPACLQALYGIPTTKSTLASNKLAVSGFFGEFAQNDDLQTFLKALRPDLVGTTFELQTLDNGTNTQGGKSTGVEANLDIQYTVGVASGVPTTFISVGSSNKDGALSGFLDIINSLLAQTSPPQVLTTSYGANENAISRALATKLCNAYMQLGARGTSLIFASGDGGVSGGRRAANCTTFVPTFPSGCPFVTTVGATTGVPETSASFSSGGFSNLFGRPSYQSAAVSGYLTALGNTNAGLFNTTGRGFPDVAAQGENVEIVDGGRNGTIAGTSCSSPIFASVIALLNARRLEANKPPLGFLNPFLYTTGKAALLDITTGSNSGCGTNGFPAKTGWDPVTGLGTPNFAALATAAGV